MTVYFAQTRIDTTKVKIGFTSNLEARRSNMSVSVPGGVFIMASIDGGRETEQYLHDRFASDCIGGEWFYLSDDLRQFVRDVQNGKQGLIPFKDEAQYHTRSTAEYAADAVEVARQMAMAILNDEYRGISDTLDAAMHRLQVRHGIKAAVFHRLRHRKKTDIWSGEYLHLKAVYEQMIAKKAVRSDDTVRVFPKGGREALLAAALAGEEVGDDPAEGEGG